MTGEPVVIVSGGVREALFAQPLVAAMEGAWVFAPLEGLPVLRLRTVGRGFVVAPGLGLVRAWQRLRAIPAGLVAVPPPAAPQSAGLAYWSGIPRRVTVAAPGQWWATERLRVPAELHPVDVVRRLAAFIQPDRPEPAGPQLGTNVTTQERLKVRLESAGGRAGDALLVAIPGRGNWTQKTHPPLWPPERFAVLANLLRPDLLVLVRGVGDTRAVREMQAGLPGRSAVLDLPATMPDELAALAGRSVGIIGHDGDALHVAAAGGGRTVALLGPGDLAPYGSHGVTIQVDDLNVVTARTVLDVARQHLGVPTHA